MSLLWWEFTVPLFPLYQGVLALLCEIARSNALMTVSHAVIGGWHHLSICLNVWQIKENLKGKDFQCVLSTQDPKATQ